MLRVGESVGGYEIVAKLRSGGMAALFLGRKEGAAGFRRHVAIKVVHEHLAEDADFVKMFIDEALLQARIQNPNVVHVEELGEADGTHFLVMEYVHGVSLAQLLVALGKRKRRLATEMAVSVAMHTAAGLHAAHELRGDDGQPLGVVHRDVSPQNVLLSRDGHVKLIDFGVAKARGRATHTSGGAIKGKIRYMPPEQAFGGAIDRRADVYALGIVLWEMLTMKKLFAAQEDLALLEQVRVPVIAAPSERAGSLPPGLDAVVLKALAAKPEDRYASAQEFRRALGEAVPKAAMVDSSSIAELIEAMLGPELEKERRALPTAVSATLAPPETVLKEAEAEEVVLTMTVSVATFDAGEGRVSLGPVSLSDASRGTPSVSGVNAQASPPLVSSEVTTAPIPVFQQPVLAAAPPTTAPTASRRTATAAIATALVITLLAVAAAAAFFGGASSDDSLVVTPLGPSSVEPAAMTAPTPPPTAELPTAAPPIAAPPIAEVPTPSAVVAPAEPVLPEAPLVAEPAPSEEPAVADSAEAPSEPAAATRPRGGRGGRRTTGREGRSGDTRFTTEF